MKNDVVQKPVELDSVEVGSPKKIDASMDELRQMIRDEMERFLFTNVCDNLKDEEESESGLGLEGDIDSLRSERTQQEADRAWKKRLHKRREEHRKEIKKKREQRHKCRAQRVKENKLFNRWKTIVFG